MRDRVIGIENEYGAIFDGNNNFSSKKKPEPLNYENILNQQLQRQYGSLGVKALIQSNRLWLLNGGCFYVDVGHLEYASPECRRIRDVIAYDKAGEMLAATIAEGLPPRSLCSRVRFVKNNVARNRPEEKKNDLLEFATFGTHENYLFYGRAPNMVSLEPIDIPQDGDRERFMGLLAFLMTRQIIDGAGRWENPAFSEFAFSQRAAFIQSEITSTTTSKRPIISTKNNEADHHLDEKSLRQKCRLHLILGDANMLDVALFLKVGTTSLVLSLLEEGKMPDIKVKAPVKAILDISDSYDPLRACVELKNGTFMSALAIQSLFCEAVEKYLINTRFDSEESEHEAHEIVELWRRALTALAENDKKWMVGRLDHATKLFIAEREIRAERNELEKRSDETIRANVEIRYHLLGDEKLSLSPRIRALWPEKCMVTDEAILHATQYPPKDTRAYARGSIVRLCVYNKGTFSAHNIDWERVQLGPEKAMAGYSIGDPLQHTFDWLEYMLRTNNTGA